MGTGHADRDSALASTLLAPLRWVERARGWRRLGLLALYGAVALGVAGTIRWYEQLAGLPDVGDPPGASPARARIPDDRNAFSAYLAAAGLYREMTGPEGTSFGEANLGWGRADASLRGWVAANSRAIGLLREGADRPGATLVGPGSAPEKLEFLRRLSWVGDAALFEAGRVREAGDPAGAWALLRAVVRASRDMQHPVPTLQGRSGGILLAQFARGPVADWANDPAVPPALLRRALGDLAAARDVPLPSEADFFRAGHREAERALADLPMGLADRLRGEPERSRRVLRLLAAHDLAWAEIPTPERPPFAIPRLGIEPSDPATPPAARALPPDDLARWVDTSRVAPALAWRLEDRVLWDRADRKTILDMLESVAVALFTRETGKPPATPAEALRRYLPAPGDSPGLDESEPVPAGPAPP